MSSSKPKRMSLGFVQWLRATGQITEEELRPLSDEWLKVRQQLSRHKVFTSVPTTWDQFVASKYPRKVLTYQAYLRMTGGASFLNKD